MTQRQGTVGILVVDDSEDFLGVACAWIESQPGLQLVGTAANGSEAIDAVARFAPDLVIMDAFMPLMDGFAATRAIKSRTPAPWIVMVSVHEGSTIEHEAWAAGADAFLVKSNFAEQVLEVVQGLREGTTVRREAPAPRPARRPEDALLEHRAFDSESMSESMTARAVRLVRDFLGSRAGARAPLSTRPRTRMEAQRPVVID